MKSILTAALVTGSVLTPATVCAQDSELDQLKAQLAAMQAEVDRLSAQVESLSKKAEQTQVAVSRQSAKAAPPPPPPAPEPQVEVSWKGAPEIEGPGGWSFKPRGRLMFDAGTVSLPDNHPGNDGFGSEVRRARLGVEGDIPGGFGYKFELDFADGGAEMTDAILTYADGGLKISAGQHNTFQSLEELTSSRFSSFIERAAFTDAFGFERRLGLSAQVKAGDFLAQAGFFTDNAEDLPSKAWSADGRVVFMPEFGDTQLHLGASVHHADLATGDTVRYRQRPLVHFTSDRFVNTGNLAADSELGLGVEAALIHGPFHAAAEFYHQEVNIPGFASDPGFSGGYAEIGYFLTGESRGYKSGTFNRTKPANPVGDGGLGALQLNLRYDNLDLNSGTITGGKQDGYLASLIWIPIAYARLMVNYGRLEYSDAAISTLGGSRDYGVDVIGVRSEIDF